MWINFKFLHMTDVEKSEISFNMCTIYGILLHFKLFCCKICVVLRFTLFCRKIGLLRFTRFCVEKILTKNSVRGEKMTNIRYAFNILARKERTQKTTFSSLLIDIGEGFRKAILNKNVSGKRKLSTRPTAPSPNYETRQRNIVFLCGYF